MSESNMVCNGHKEHNLNKSNNTVTDVLSFNNSTTKCENTSKDSMTIGISFRDFDHMYASSGEETQMVNPAKVNAARSYLDSCHLNIIEEQARIIETQNRELTKLKKENESLLARIERINRQLNGNQFDSNSSFSDRNKCQTLRKNSNYLRIEAGNADSDYEDASLRTHNSFDVDGEQPDKIIHDDLSVSNDKSANSIDEQKEMPANNNSSRDIRIRFHGKKLSVNDGRRKGNKMVRFVEAKRRNCGQGSSQFRRLSAQTVDEKLKMENTVLFLNSVREHKLSKHSVEDNLQTGSESLSDLENTDVPSKKKLRLNLLTSNEAYHIATREDLYDPVTYIPTALEVPSFRIVDKDNFDAFDVPQNFNEDVSLDAARERHLRFESDEKKRKRWDVQRIRELRQNERLKEKLRRRKSRWSKLESPNAKSNDSSEQITTLFPDIRSIEKIIITDSIPVTALGCSISKIPLWSTEFQTDWKNDGTTDVSLFEDTSTSSTHQQYHKDSKSRTG